MFSPGPSYKRVYCFLLPRLIRLFPTLQSSRTFNVGLEWTSRHMNAAGIFDGDEIVARCAGHVGELVTISNLLTVELHLGWAIHRHRQRARARLLGVNNELARLPYSNTTRNFSSFFEQTESLLPEYIHNKIPLSCTLHSQIQ